MKAKAKIILDLDNKVIKAIDFKDSTLNSCTMTKGLRDILFKKVMRIGVGRFDFVPNLSEDPIGNPYLLLETTVEVYPKIYSVDNKFSPFKLACLLQVTPCNNNITFEEYALKRKKYAAELSNKISEMQNK